MPSKSKKQHNLMAAVANNPAFAKKVGISKSVGEEFMKADKTKKFGSGGSLKATDSSENPGLSKLPTEVRNKMGYMKKGGMAMKKGMKEGGMAYKEGGKADMAQDKKTVKKAVGMHEKQLHGGKKSNLAKLKTGGMAKMAKGGGIEVRGKTKGKMCQENIMGLFSKRSATATASPDGSVPAEGKGFFGSVLRDAIGQIKAQGGFKGGFGSGMGSTSGTKVALDLVDDKFEGKGMKKGGKVKASSASKRADGCAVRGKTKGKMCQENNMAKKETPATTQAEYDKAFEDVKSGKQPVPSFDDMGPKGKGLEFVDPKNNERVRKSQEAARAQMLKNIKESFSGPEVPGEYRKKGGAIKAKKMAKGGTASSRADGCAVRGKTRA